MGQRDGQTPDRFIDSAPHTMRAASIMLHRPTSGWLGSRVVSVLDSGAERAWVQIAVASLSGSSLRQTVHTYRASVHQAAKLVAALLRVARVTAGLAASNGSLPSGRVNLAKVGHFQHFRCLLVTTFTIKVQVTSMPTTVPKLVCQTIKNHYCIVKVGQLCSIHIHRIWLYDSDFSDLPLVMCMRNGPSVALRRPRHVASALIASDTSLP